MQCFLILLRYYIFYTFCVYKGTNVPFFLFHEKGAAQAIEDGATLGVLFSQIESVDEIPDLLKLYEKIRRPRAEKIQKGALDNGDIWHMPDGDDQIARDKAMKIVVSDDTVQKVHVKNPNQWSDGDFQPWLFGHDAIAVAKKALSENLNGYSNVEERASL